MKIPDHIVYCVPNLQKGMAAIESLFGVAPIYGGRHLTKGTHNALLNLSNGCYFEILAPDPENTQIEPPLWMSVDNISKPRITRWSVKTNDFENDISKLKNIRPELAETFIGSRKTSTGSILNWKMSLPLARPEVEIFPFLLDWQNSIHPTENLPEICRLISIEATHPQPTDFLQRFEKMNIKMTVKKANWISLIAKIETPNGIVEI